MESSSKQYNNFAKHYANNENFSPVGRVTLYKILNNIELEGKNVLDIGCGHGCDLEYFYKQKSNMFGRDVSNELLKITKKRVPKAKLSSGSFDTLPYKNNTFSLVFSRYALQHVKSIEKTTVEVARVLKPQGHFIFLVTHPLRQFLEKEGNNYWVKEIVESEILDNTVTVKEYSYTFKEYLSPTLLKNFSLEFFEEEFDREAEQKNKAIYPGYAIFHYKKRGK